jgi:uncharacterized protein YjbI with pentapeptide repeats
MANKKHLKILQQGATAWNDWRRGNPEVRPDLHGADLSGENYGRIDLSWTDLSGADLRGVNLREANLSAAHLRGIDLSRANLNGADLTLVDLGKAHLSGADLRGADLRGARLAGTSLIGLDIEGAWIGYTTFSDIDLSEIKGLETVLHQGPSTVGIDTIYKSKGKIPEVFLRGCGVPDTMIAYTASLVGQPIQYYSCFVSYSSQDQECAERLHADLQSKGVRCWFAPEDMKTGDKILDRIDREIRVYDKLLLIFSEHSIESDWVETEVQAALEKERRQKRTMLFPIRLDDAVMETGEAWAAKVRRERHITDLRGWKNHDTYQKQFARLLRDLQAVDAQEVITVEPAPSPKPRSRPTETYRVKLRQNLVAAFNESELRDLCFDMNVDYESLNGENKADKARELVAFCERRQSMPDLVARCRELRPNTSWEGEYE